MIINNKEKRDFLALDVAVIIAIPFTAFLLTMFFKWTYIPSMVAFFVVPSLYLSFRNPQIVKKTISFAALMFIPMTLLWDYLIYVDQVWYVPSNFRFLNNAIPLEDVIWAFFWIYFAVVVWEYFLDFHKPKEHFPKNIRYLLIILGVVVVGFFSFYFFQPGFLNQPYAYLKLALVFMVLPVVPILIKFPKIIRKLIVVGIYFLVLSGLYETAALANNQWWFPGIHYLGTTTLLGHTVPYDEIIIWWVLSVPALIVWYEFFADDRR